MRKAHANILIHHSAYYRQHTFAHGFEQLGYNPINDRNASPTKDDVLLIWNRSPNVEKIAQAYEAVGATVLVTENGYIGNTKALARSHHSGAGEWHVGDFDRFSQLDIEVQDWRKDGDHILVLPQRSIGEIGVAMPRNWERMVIDRLKKLTDRPIKVRRHPGKQKDQYPVEEELKNAWAACIWGSGAGIKSLIAGVPVFYDLAGWIGAGASSCVWDIENPYMGDRMETLHRLAWAQWTWQEIHDGVPFKWLL